MIQQIATATIICLFFTMLLYIYVKIAKSFNLTINIRRTYSQSQPVIGAGFIFPVGILLLLLFFDDVPIIPQLAFVALAVTSFIDDIKSLPVVPRLVVQLIATFSLVSELFSGLDVDNRLFAQIGCVLLIISYLNASNFMDGINGMLIVNAVISLSALFIINLEFYFVHDNALLGLICVCLVFAFGNVRKAPIFISGDVGSISLGFILIWFCIELYMVTDNPMVFLIISVFCIDVAVTLAHTIFKRHNPFKAHRNHLYEKLVYRDLHTDLKVTAIYGLIHLLVCAFVVYCIIYTIDSVFVLGLSFLCLIVFYCIFRFFIVK
ncbi:hypothetical protein Q2T40_18890 [Winogradskyella maritima]|uniref:UDP-N-acetylmuramyl pentapeptide phosphotransferase/UDP-N-acetylglucosamine-1-phosphate transferase n=1 Tax=Winogradskyella maritima TaxID=1517766 RepID=A0ABV8AEM6_9FLAO|nr:hypothetical protein [Winogradskyella maritima]